MYHKRRLIILLSILTLLIPTFVFAQNKIYIAPETAVTWTDTGGDEVLDMGGLATDDLAVGSFLDLGANSRSSDYVFTFFVDQFETDPVVGESIDLYWATGTDTANFDGVVTTAPGDSSTGTAVLAETPNLMYAGSAIVTTTTAASAKLRISGFIRFFNRYIFPVIHNNTADALNRTGDTHSITLIPVPPEVQ